MYLTPLAQHEPDLEEQVQRLRLPETALIQPKRTHSTREPLRKVGISNTGAKRSIQSQSSATTRPSESQQKKGQVVFVCGGDNDLTRWAIQVKVHAAVSLARRRGSKPEKRCACENCDVVIYQNLNRAFWAQVGSWRRYVPFYGIVKVEEVKVFTSQSSCIFTSQRLCTSSTEQLGLSSNFTLYRKIGTASF